MKRLNRWAPAAALAGTLAAALLTQGCSQTTTAPVAQSPAAPADTRAADEAAIRADSAAWSAATEAKDADKAVSFYAPDAVVFDDGGPIQTDPAKFREEMQPLVDAKNMTLAWKTTKVEVARSGDMAYEYGAYHFDTKMKNGKVSTQTGKYVLVWKKQPDGSWKVAIDTDNSDTPRRMGDPAK
jgi:ketosteroid isomerase-like protein